MADRPKQFGRRNRTEPAAKPVKTPRPPQAAPPTTAPAQAAGSPTLKRSLTVGFVAAGALAALATHQIERTPAKDTCTPTGSAALPGSTGTPPAATDAAATGGGIGGAEPCPPGTTRQASSTHRSPAIFLVGRSLFSGWNWSSSSRRSTDHLFSAFSASKSSPSVAASSVSRGGFGSIGAGRSSGGS